MVEASNALFLRAVFFTSPTYSSYVFLLFYGGVFLGKTNTIWRCIYKQIQIVVRRIGDYMFTEIELNWIREVLSDYDPFEISSSYIYKKKTEIERDSKKEIVRLELDELRKEMINVTPQELIDLRNKKERENRFINNFSGIYIIHNCEKDIFYIGQSEGVFDRAYMHFVNNKGNAEVYNDYSLGDKFNISLIPLKSTSFSSLNELEDYAIRAYDSLVPYGYNRNPGNIMDKPIFKNDEYQKVAYLLLDRVKGTELFLSLSNRRNRMAYIIKLLSDYKLPRNTHFIICFVDLIKNYQKVNKNY